MDDTEFISTYLTEIWASLHRIDLNALTLAADALYEAWKGDRVVLFCGNGGSGASKAVSLVA